METVEKKKAAPPYVAYKTLKNFLERFKQALPSRIDRGLMGSMSGAAQSQVVTAMRYLGMISESGLPTQLMRRYVTGEEAESKAALMEMLMAAYPFIFETVDSDEFHISSATSQQLREVLEANTTATGETLDRCIAFVKDAALDAGFKVSPYILQKKGRTPGARKKTNALRKNERVSEKPMVQPSHASVAAPFPAQSSLLLSGLFQRLPKPGTVWARDQRERWVQTLNNVLMLEYRKLRGMWRASSWC